MLKKKLIALTAAFMTAVSMVSCGSENNSQPGCMIEILGINSNMPFPDTSLLTVGGKNPYKDICESGGLVQAIVVDGNPRNNIGQPYNITPLNRSDYTELNYNRNIENAANAIEAGITEGLEPKCAETNLIDAIITASEIIKPYDGQKYIPIFHSGIITEGYGSMTKLDFDVDATIEALYQAKAIPDLTGVKVEWYGMNNVCGSQDQPNEENKANLRAFWEAYFTKAGAEYKNMSEIYSTFTQPDSSYYEVRPVVAGSIWKPGPDDEGNEEPVTPPVSEDTTSVEFPNDGSFEFQKNTAVFINAEAAKRDIKPFAEYLKSENAMENVVLVGTTATVGDAEGSIALSKERAEAIKALIVNEGVDESRIKAFGGGYTDADFVTRDLDDKGNLIEAFAQLNRSVHAVSSNDPRVQKYLN